MKRRDLMHRMRRITLLFCLIGMMGAAVAQDNDPVILIIEENTITKSEFESIFRKNNQDADVSEDALREYMQLFVNFKLKVLEAQELGMDTVQKFLRELDGYRTQLARPYLTDESQNESLLEEAYERKKEEIKASHLLIQVAPDASPSDTLKAWKKITDLRKKAKAGSDFAELARQHSEDPSAKDNGGNLGYFSALQMVYPFENAAYNTPVGSISQPIRTRFGYHLVQVNDRRPSRGEIRAAHIMIRSSENDSPERQKRAERQIREVHEELNAGGDFTDLALKYSDDGSSSGKGGELPWFGAGKMVEEFENAAFALSENGEISEPVKSRFGWHIIKRLDYKPVPSKEEMRNDLKTRISKDSRSEITRKAFVNKLKKEYSFKEYPRQLRPVINVLDTNIYYGSWDPSKGARLNAVLFELDGKKYTQQDFINYLADKQTRRRKSAGSLEAFGNDMYAQFVDETVFNYEDSKLEEKYPEFRALMREYHDGILLFELTDMMVWTRAVRDSAGLDAFYQDNKENYKYGERAEGVFYICSDSKVAATAQKMARKGKSDEDIRKKLNKISDLSVRMEEFKAEREKHDFLSKVDWQPGVSDTFEHKNQVAFVHIHKIHPPEPKPLSEVRGLVTAAYQNHLEQEWIQELRKKYFIDVKDDVLMSIR